MKKYRDKLLFKILLSLFLLVAFGAEIYMSISIIGSGSVSYKENSAIEYVDSKDKKTVSLKYHYKNEFNAIMKYDNTYSVIGVLSSYDENIKIYEQTTKYISNTTNVGESSVIELNLDSLDINLEDYYDKLHSSELTNGKLVIYYNVSIKAANSKLSNNIELDNKDNITINLEENGYTINDKDSSTNNNMTIRDVSSKLDLDGLHTIYAIIALGAFIVSLVSTIKFVKRHKEATNYFENKIKRVTKGYEDRIVKGKTMNYPKKVTYVDVDNFEELVKVSKKAKDNIREYMIDENEVIYAVRLEDEVYQYKITKEE